MRVRTALVWASGAALSLGLVSLPAAATAEDNGSPTATVTQTAGVFTVTLPGVGTVSFGVDPTTNELTGLTVTSSDPSVTAGTPVITEEGVQVRFNTSTGAEFLEVEVEHEGAVPQVTAEVALPEDVENGDMAGNNESGHDGTGNDGPDNANASGDDQQAAGTAPTVAPDREDNGDVGDVENGEPTTTTTTTTMPAGTATSASTQDGGSSDGGSTSSSPSGDSGSGNSGTSGDSAGSSSDGSGSGSGSDG